MSHVQRLGFSAPVDPAWAAHAERCRTLPGWSTVACTPEQTDEFVDRLEAFRRKRERSTN